MKKPITLHIPNYFDLKAIVDNRLILTKTQSLLEEDSNRAQYIATIEKIDNYQCTIPEIGEEYRKRATNCFFEDRKGGWELPIKVSNCKVFTYHWDDQNYHFRIYWIEISDQYMLQLFGFFEPKYSAFYKRHFMTYVHSIKIDTGFDFSQTNKPEELFLCKPVNIDSVELQELIDDEKQKAAKAKYLKENLKLSSPNFYSVVETELKEKHEATVENFLCTDWNMYYDLYNPENFSDPDSTVEWEDNSDVFDYYEKPLTDNTKVTIVCNETPFEVETKIPLQIILKAYDKRETKENILTYFNEVFNENDFDIEWKYRGDDIFFSAKTKG